MTSNLALTVADVIQSRITNPSVDVDDYIPIRFRSYSDPISSKRIRIGSLEDQALEILLSENSVVTGFTLIAAMRYDKRSVPWKRSSREGLPLLEVPSELKFIGRGPFFASMAGPIEISRCKGRLQVLFAGGLASTDEISLGTVQFLLHNLRLIGVRIVDLSCEQDAIIDRYFARRALPIDGDNRR